MPETDISALRSELPDFADAFHGAILKVGTYLGDLTVELSQASLRPASLFLKYKVTPAYSVMMDLTAVDYLKFSIETPERFAVLYNFYSIESGKRIFLKVWVPEETPRIPSIENIYPAANWFEREVWDLFGIVFDGHPNLARILTHNEFVGHPLRKDYPATGYQQLRKASPSAEL